MRVVTETESSFLGEALACVELAGRVKARIAVSIVQEALILAPVHARVGPKTILDFYFGGRVSHGRKRFRL